MPETDATIIDNWFPQPTWVELRKGQSVLGTFTGQCETVAAFNALNSANNRLFAAVNNSGVRSIYRVDNANGGSAGSPVVGGSGPVIQTITNTQYDWAQYAIGSSNYLYLVNGVDNPLLWDGTTWTAITGASSPAITGVTTSTLATVAVYKQRLWFTDGTFKVWYLPQNSIGGAALSFDLGPLAKLGGALQSIVTVSIDNAQGAQDYIAFVSNQGEVFVFQGYDPSNINTWSLAAHFRIGRPIGKGRRCWQKLGSDAVIINADGFIMLSEAMLTDRSQSRNAVSDKIRKSVTDDVGSYPNNFGWQAVLYPIGNKLIINVPTVQNSASYMYVMNTLNGAWCTFGKYASAWNAYCWEVQGDNLYFGTSGSVNQADTGQSDAGAGIQALIKPAYSYFDARGQLKRWTMVRPVFTASGNVSVAMNLSVDYDATLPTGSIPISSGNNPFWNVSFWTTPTFWGNASQIIKRWLGISGVGYSASLQLQVIGLNVSLQWQSTDYVFEVGGIFG